MSTTFAHSSLRGSGLAHLNKIKQRIDPTPILQSETLSLYVYINIGRNTALLLN